MTDPAPAASSVSAAAGADGREPPVARGYALAGCAIFLLTVIKCWTAHVDLHEMVYLLGSRRVADPGFLAADFTWSVLPATSALYDHMLAPLWSVTSDFGIVNIGRLVSWILFAWSLARVARALRLPPWSALLGFAIWLLWDQTLASCGSPIEGLQLKSFSYPLLFFSIALVLGGRMWWAGLLAGLATALHLVVGGWGCLAIFLGMCFDRERFPIRRLVLFPLAAAICIVPLLLRAGVLRGPGMPGAEQALIDRIYVTFAMPHCCDFDYFMSIDRWIRAAFIFTAAPLVILMWPRARAARFVGAFVLALILFFVAGEIAQRLGFHGLLKLYPAQLANSLPALFLFMLVPAWIGAGGASRRFGRVGWAMLVLGSLWLTVDRNVIGALGRMPGEFALEVRKWIEHRPKANEPLYGWIRRSTPRNSVFITPFLPEFWPYAERAQVASIRHSPLDRRLIEWKARLEALNGFHPYARRGFDITAEEDTSEAALPIAELIRIRGLYGATHYLAKGERPDLASHRLHSAMGYSVYDLTTLKSDEGGGAGRGRAP